MIEKKRVGILVDASIYKRIPTGRTKFENIRYYEEAAAQHDVTPCFFRIQNLRPKANRIEAYIKEENQYRRRWIPIPRVIHNRAMLFKKSSRDKIKRLVRQGHHVFNPSTRYRKYKIHRLLMKDPVLHPHLPDTARANVKNLRAWMAKYPVLILKPDSSSIGIGIMKLEKKGSFWYLHYPRTRLGKRWGKIRFRRKLPRLLIEKIRKRRYLVQEKIPLATFKDRPFDLRVSVQRGFDGEWKITGIAGKVAAHNKFLTNVAQGGKVHSLHALLQHHPDWNADLVVEQISLLSIRIAEQISQYIAGIADLGLDIGLNQEGFPYFIECNARDLRVSFQKGRMLKEWRTSYANPIAFAASIMEKNDGLNIRQAELEEQAKNHEIQEK